jgi:hypothetical protein
MIVSVRGIQLKLWKTNIDLMSRRLHANATTAEEIAITEGEIETMGVTGNIHRLRKESFTRKIATENTGSTCLMRGSGHSTAIFICDKEIHQNLLPPPLFNQDFLLLHQQPLRLSLQSRQENL